jgi:hypothetical protein
MWRWQQIAVVLRDPLLGAELGVKQGKFTEHLLGRFPKLHMVAVDLWEPRAPSGRRGYETYDQWNFDEIQSEYRHRTAGFAERLTTMRCDTKEAAAGFPDRSFDFVFIDAEHTYEGVKADIAAWRPKLKPGGLLSGHDYCTAFQGVCDAVNELRMPVEFGTDKVWMIRV